MNGVVLFCGVLVLVCVMCRYCLMVVLIWLSSWFMCLVSCLFLLISVLLVSMCVMLGFFVVKLSIVNVIVWVCSMLFGFFVMIWLMSLNSVCLMNLINFLYIFVLLVKC